MKGSKEVSGIGSEHQSPGCNHPMDKIRGSLLAIDQIPISKYIYIYIEKESTRSLSIAHPQDSKNAMTIIH